MALLEDASNFDRLLQIHRSIQDAWATAPYDQTTSLLFACSPNLRQVIVTSLVHLYSHSTAALNRYAVAEELAGLTKDAATRSMFILRCVVQVLAQHTATPWIVALNPWQAHLLQHYERMAPFPPTTTSQEEVIEEIWGREWPLVIQLRTRSHHHKIYELAMWCRTLGLNLTQLATDLRPHLTDEGIVRMSTVKTMRQQYRQLSYKIRRLAASSADLETLNKPKMVELKSWTHLGRRTQPPAFLFHRPSHLNRSSAAFEEMFPPSGLRPCDEAEYREREALLVRFGDADDARSSPELSFMPNSNAGPSRFVDIKPKIPPNDIIDLSTLSDSETSTPQPHPKYYSPPPSHSPSPESLEIVKTHGWTALAVIKKEPEIELKWDSEDEAEEVSRNQHSQSTEDAVSAVMEQPSQYDDGPMSASQEQHLVKQSSASPAARSSPPRHLNLPLGISPPPLVDSNDDERDPVDEQPASASQNSEHGPGSSRMPVSSSPVSPLVIQPRAPRSPLSPVAFVEPNDGKMLGKRPAEAMLSGTPEPESAKRVKEAEGSSTQSPERTRISKQAQTEEHIKADAEEAKRFERAWTVDSEMWADILRCDSDSEVEDVKPVIPQEPLETEPVSSEDVVEAGIEKEHDESGEPALLQRKLGVKEISPDFLPRLKQAEADHVEFNEPRQPLQKVILQSPVRAISAVSNESLAPTHPQAARGLNRAKVAIDVVRRQLTKVHVGSQLFLRIGRNEKGNYDVHQDVREETRNLASIRATPEIEADITQFFETIGSSLLDYAATLEIGEEISLKISMSGVPTFKTSLQASLAVGLVIFWSTTMRPVQCHGKK